MLSRFALADCLEHIHGANRLAGVGGGDKVVRRIRLQVADGGTVIGAAGIVHGISRLCVRLRQAGGRGAVMHSHIERCIGRPRNDGIVICQVLNHRAAGDGDRP